MVKYKRGDVVVLEIPFFERNGSLTSKGRPAVIVSSQEVHRKTQDVIIAVISSKIHHPSDFNYLIEENSQCFKKSGLLYPSIVKCVNLFYISKDKINSKLGYIPKKYMDDVDEKIKKVLFE